MIENMNLHIHKFHYPYVPDCFICRESTKDMIQIERTYETDSAHVADSIHICYDCIGRMDKRKKET